MAVRFFFINCNNKLIHVLPSNLDEEYDLPYGEEEDLDAEGKLSRNKQMNSQPKLIHLILLSLSLPLTRLDDEEDELGGEEGEDDDDDA